MSSNSSDTPTPGWCIVAHVVGEHGFGPGGAQTRVGTRKLRAGSKVYVIGSFPGGGSATVTVVGRLRYTNRYTTIHVAAKYLRDHRVSLVYSPHVLGELRAHSSATWDCGSPEAREHMENLADVIVTYAGRVRLTLRDGPLAGQRRTFPAGDVPAELQEQDAAGDPVRYVLRNGPRRSWYALG